MYCKLNGLRTVDVALISCIFIVQGKVQVTSCRGGEGVFRDPSIDRFERRPGIYDLEFAPTDKTSGPSPTPSLDIFDMSSSHPCLEHNQTSIYLPNQSCN